LRRLRLTQNVITVTAKKFKFYNNLLCIKYTNSEIYYNYIYIYLFIYIYISTKQANTGDFRLKDKTQRPT